MLELDAPEQLVLCLQERSEAEVETVSGNEEAGEPRRPIVTASVD